MVTLQMRDKLPRCTGGAIVSAKLGYIKQGGHNVLLNDHITVEDQKDGTYVVGQRGTWHGEKAPFPVGVRPSRLICRIDSSQSTVPSPPPCLRRRRGKAFYHCR